MKEGKISSEKIGQTLAADFSHPGKLVAVGEAFFLKNENLKSPMRGDVATFSSAADRDLVKKEVGGGEELDWEMVSKNF